MIYVHPVGGLGNMFFHISSIYALAKDNEDDLCLLNIPQKIAHLKADRRGDISHADQFIYFFNRFHTANGNISYKAQYPNEYRDLEYRKDHEYVGYFQSEIYFKHRRDEILNLFRPTKEMEDLINNKYSHLFGNISLHVRRADYVNLYPHLHIPQDMNYYNKALDMLPKDMKVVIFSDDFEWCKNNFVGDRYVFVDEVDYICLYLMKKMKHFIIANSSFSWWGAWMSDSEDKTVIAPTKWFGGHMKDQDLRMKIIPENWIRI